MTAESLASRIKDRAVALGYDLVGVSPVEAPTHGEAFAGWLQQGYQGEMAYMARTADQRMHPEHYLSWARSVVSVGLNYNTPYARKVTQGKVRGWISRYALSLIHI